MEQIAKQTLPPGAGYEWTAMSYQEKLVGNQIYFVFALASCSSISCSPGSTRAGSLPLAVILAVPLALLGTAAALIALGVANNLYTQIGLMLLIALASKNAHPDRRVRARAARGGQVESRRRGRGGARCASGRS